MATVNERLAALEAAVKNVTPGTTTGTISTVYVQSSDDAVQNNRLASLESQLPTLEAQISSVSAAASALAEDIEASNAAIAALEARVEVLEDKPGGSVAYVRSLAQSLGPVGAENIVTSVTTSAPSGYSTLVLAEASLVAYWRLGESSGTTLDNAEGTAALDGTIVGGVTLGVTGALEGDADTAATFDGTSGYFYVADNAALDVGDTFTIEFWIKRTNSNDGFVIDKGRTGGSAFAIFMDSGYLRLCSNTTLTPIVYFAYTDTTSWHHVAFTKNGATAKAYLDGADVTITGTNQTLGNTTDDLRVGTSTYYSTDYMAASLDEVALYSTALLQADINEHYTATGSGGGGGGGGGSYVEVTTIADLLYYLADNDVTEIVLKNSGSPYTVTTSNTASATSLAIDSRFAGRTNPVLVRAETTGSVVFDGGDGNFPVLAFRGGARYQTWRGFTFSNINAEQCGIIEFGAGGLSALAPAHHITLEDCTVDSTCFSTAPVSGSSGHAVYFSMAYGEGPNNIIIDNLTVDGDTGTTSLDSAFHFYHSQTGYYNAHDVLITGCTVTGTDQAIILWDATAYNITFKDTTITSSKVAIRQERQISGLVFNNVDTFTSTSVAYQSNLFGVTADGGAASPSPVPTGTTWTGCSLD